MKKDPKIVSPPDDPALPFEVPVVFLRTPAPPAPPAPIVTVIAELLIAIAAYIKVKKESGFSISMKGFNTILFASIIMGLILYLFASIPIGILIIIGVIVYGLILWPLRSRLSLSEI